MLNESQWPRNMYSDQSKSSKLPQDHLLNTKYKNQEKQKQTY